MIIFGDQDGTHMTITDLASENEGEFIDIRSELEIDKGAHLNWYGTPDHQLLTATLMLALRDKFLKPADLSTMSGAWRALWGETNLELNTRTAGRYLFDKGTTRGKVFFRIIWLLQLHATLSYVPRNKAQKFLKRISEMALETLGRELTNYSEEMLRDYGDSLAPIGKFAKDRKTDMRLEKELVERLNIILKNTAEYQLSFIDEAEKKGTIWSFMKDGLEGFGKSIAP
jgi:hypothetical protein